MAHITLLCIALVILSGGESQRAGEGYARDSFAEMSAHADEIAEQERRLEKEERKLQEEERKLLEEARRLEELENLEGKEPGFLGKLWLRISEGITTVSERVAAGGKYLGRGVHLLPAST